MLGNGGTTAFWDIAAFGLIRERSQHLTFGEFSSKFAKVAKKAPWLGEPTVITSEPGTHPRAGRRGGRRRLRAHPQRDLHRRRHADQARGRRRRPSSWWTPPPAPAACRSTSRETDVYYFAPQKCFASDGGLWIALFSPRARWPGSRRSPPPAATCRSSSACRWRSTTPPRTRRTTPRRSSTLFLLADQLEWMNGNGGLAWTTARTADSAQRLYTWADKSSYATPFVADPAPLAGRRHDRLRRRASTPPRSPRCCAPTASSTPSPTASWAATSCASAMFPAIDPADVEALTACVDYVVERL